MTVLRDPALAPMTVADKKTKAGPFTWAGFRRFRTMG